MHKCETCDKEFDSLRALCGHQVVHNRETIKCPICDREISKNNYEVHLKSHEEEKECPVCGAKIPKHKKFCCQSHAAIYSNKHRERKKKVSHCEHCGKELVGWKNARNRFCSQECAIEYSMKEKDKEYFAGKIVQQQTLKRHFLKHNENKCSICGLTSWQDQPIVLVLDHIDGNPENNLPENLRLVCPNCNSQLPTFAGRNRGNGRAYRRQRYRENKSY